MGEGASYFYAGFHIIFGARIFTKVFITFSLEQEFEGIFTPVLLERILQAIFTPVFTLLLEQELFLPKYSPHYC